MTSFPAIHLAFPAVGQFATFQKWRLGHDINDAHFSASHAGVSLLRQPLDEERQRIPLEVGIRSTYAPVAVNGFRIAPCDS